MSANLQVQNAPLPIPASVISAGKGSNSEAMAVPELSTILSLARKAIDEQDKAETALGKGQQRLAYCAVAFHADALMRKDAEYTPPGWRKLYESQDETSKFIQRITVAVLGEPVAKPNLKSTDVQRVEYAVYASKKTMLSQAVKLASMLGLCQSEDTAFNPVLSFDQSKGWFKVPGKFLCAAEYEPNKYLEKQGAVYLNPKVSYRVEKGGESIQIYSSVTQFERATTSRHDMVTKKQAAVLLKEEQTRLAAQAKQNETQSAASVAGAASVTGATTQGATSASASNPQPQAESLGDAIKLIQEVAKIFRADVKATKLMTPSSFGTAWNDLVYISSICSLIRDADIAATAKAKAERDASKNKPDAKKA